MSTHSQITWADAATLDRAAREDLLQAWRDACDDLASAFAGWCHAAPADGRLAFAAYLAGADREATAADAFERACSAGA
jgi:hypothetical protein